MNLNRKEREEVSQLIELSIPKKDSSARISRPSHSSMKMGEVKAFITLMLTVITLCVGAALWASSSHSDIREEYVSKVELKEVAEQNKEKFAPQKDIAVIREKLENNGLQHAQLQKTLDKLDRKLDKIQESQ